ncbi:hypothetical protein SAMN02745248_02399 [Hathewaya proteolytica DSM 3090]|uniref:Prophage protein n=1 Tax=Hathewaya proteolytica DSM 3090 TaxID=1121331 RepID=A0A1M6RZG2_9CLOT|nr:DUF6711 family protein [Hathewaya proteolytica]SHK37728.1 hypothetical protein SAMN02745248_02399 [Hathewaya proteolytica DSM 3090]
MLKINGVAIAAPKVFVVDFEDIDGESGRNTRGQMLRDRIAVKRKLTCEWPPLEDGEISILLKAVQNVFFEVAYPDPAEGATITKTFYVGTRTAPMLYMGKWQNLKMNFIER